MDGPAYYKASARFALSGKWLIAALTGFVASILGGTIATAGGSSGSGNNDSYDSIWQGVPQTEALVQLQLILTTGLTVLLIWALITVVIGGAAKLGYAKFNLNLIDQKETRLSDLFSQFHRLGDGFAMNFMMGLFTFLWSLLLIIPGIIKRYSYAMTPYILAENPGMPATEAITQSRFLMNGNKFGLFCLELSFLGWSFLCMAPLIIAALVTVNAVAVNSDISALLWLISGAIPSFVGTLFLRPYREATHAAFYRDISGT